MFGVADAAGTAWTIAAANGVAATLCGQFVFIPGLSKDGINSIPIEPGVKAYQSQVCGTNFGLEMKTTADGIISEALVSKYFENPMLHVHYKVLFLSSLTTTLRFGSLYRYCDTSNRSHWLQSRLYTTTMLRRTSTLVEWWSSSTNISGL